jgi:hypothetical protein
VGRASPAIASFAGGEWAPQMEGRVDQERYQVAAHIQQNMIALKQGPSTLRQGTAYVQPTKNPANRAWLYPFEFSQTQAFLIEFGNFYVRFYTNHGPLLSTGNPAYNAASAYLVGAQVVSGGITYYCIAASTGNAPPNPTYWYAMSPYNGSASTAIYEIPSPYAVADLTDPLGEFALQFNQSGDVLYIAGGYAGVGPAGVGYPPYTLTRYANAPPNWQFAQYAPTDGPFSNPLPLVPGSEIALTVSAAQGMGITILAWGGSVFAPTDVGRLVRIGSQLFNQIPWQTNVGWTAGQICSNNGNNYIALDGGTSGSSPPVHTAGSVVDGMGTGGIRWLYTDSNYGVAQITAVVNQSQVTANVLRQFPANVVVIAGSITAITNANPCVVTTTLSTGQIPAGVAIFITGVQGMTQLNGNNNPVGSFLSAAALGGPSVQLAGVDSTTFGTYTGGGTFVANATTEWQLGAWSNTTEWPRALDEFKDRLCWAGKHNVWGSVPGLYNSQTPDFFNVETTDSAFNTLVPGSDNIVWLSAAIILLVGTAGGEYGIDAASYSASPLGPSNIECLRQSRWRCRPITPSLVGTTVLYAQRAGRKIFAMDYNFYLNRYDSTDQQKTAYHITIGGLSGFCYQQEPWSILWGWRADGTLLSYTFNREDQVTAWCRHNMGNGGLVESAACIPAPDGLRDEVWFIVNRTINGAVVRTVEYMVKQYEGPQAGYVGDAQSSCWYVDCGVQSVAPGTTQLTGLPPVMWNQAVSILADGGPQPQQVVSSTGTLSLSGSFTTVTVGFPYQGNLVPMRFEGGADAGTAQGKIKNGTKLVVRLVDTYGCTVSQLTNVNPATGAYQDPLGQTILTPQLTEQVFQNYPTTLLNAAPPLQSGDFPISFPENASSEQDKSDYYVLVQQNLPLPMTVVGLFPSYQVSEPR